MQACITLVIARLSSVSIVIQVVAWPERLPSPLRGAVHPTAVTAAKHGRHFTVTTAARASAVLHRHCKHRRVLWREERSACPWPSRATAFHAKATHHCCCSCCHGGSILVGWETIGQ